MKTYRKMTLNDLIEALGALPDDAQVAGFNPEIDSYRGYYERNAVEPSAAVLNAHEVALTLRAQEGKPITGYKGGDYQVNELQGIYLANYGELGPCFCGLEQRRDGVYEPVLIDDGMIW